MGSVSDSANCVFSSGSPSSVMDLLIVEDDVYFICRFERRELRLCLSERYRRCFVLPERRIVVRFKVRFGTSTHSSLLLLRDNPIVVF